MTNSQVFSFCPFFRMTSYCVSSDDSKRFLLDDDFLGGEHCRSRHASRSGQNPWSRSLASVLAYSFAVWVVCRKCFLNMKQAVARTPCFLQWLITSSTEQSMSMQETWYTVMLDFSAPRRPRLKPCRPDRIPFSATGLCGRFPGPQLLSTMRPPVAQSPLAR